MSLFWSEDLIGLNNSPTFVLQKVGINVIFLE